MRNAVSTLTDERLIQLIEIHGGKNTEIARVTNLTVRSIQRKRALLAHKGHAPDQGLHTLYPEGFNLGKVTIQRSADGTIERTWERMCADNERKQEMLRVALAAMVEDLPRCLPRNKLTAALRADLVTLYPIGDPHIGMYAWGDETGDNWDLKIAEQVHCDAMQTVVESSMPSERCIVANMGDLFHYDSLAAVTPRSGHNLDADGRYALMIRIGVKVMRRCIESALSKHQFVHVINLPGNHDETGALWLALALSIAYENEPRVTVDVNPSLFSYYRFGKNLLGFHHGHACKPAMLPGVMAADRAQDWGETEHRAWWGGHVHHEQRKEYPGVTFETVNTLAAKDSHAANHGYRSARVLQGITYHRERGEIQRTRVNAATVEKRA